MRAAPELDRIKRRCARRRRDAGAVMFVVAMTISVLASVGIYALAAASNEVATSGNERQSTQTHYMADYGILATAHQISGPSASFYFALSMQSPNSPCNSLPGVPSTASPQTRACHAFLSSELAQTWTVASATVSYGANVPFSNGVTPGSFGTTPTQGDFYVELTDPVKASAPARFSQDNQFCIIEFTATVEGLIEPWNQLAAVTNFEGEGIETQRARIMAGPITCPR